MSEMTYNVLFCFFMFSMAGWFILFAGISTYRNKRRREEVETTRTTGRIVDYVLKERPKGKGGTSVYWKPVIEFSVYPHTYRLEYDNALKESLHPVGENVEILYDLNDPSHFHLEDDPVYINGGRKAIRFGVIWILASAAITMALAVFVGGLSLRDTWMRIRYFLRLY